MKGRKKMKRLAAFTAAANIMLVYVFVLGSVTVSAFDKTEAAGYWKLKEAQTHVEESELTSSTGWEYSASASELSHMYRAHLPANEYHGPSTGVFTATCSSPPGEIRIGDKVVMHMTLDMQDSATMLISQYCVLQTGGLNDERNGLAYNVGEQFEATKEGADNECYMDTCDNPSNPAAEVYHVFENTGKPGEEMVISFYGCAASTIWIYEWIDTTPAALPEEVTEPALEESDNPDGRSGDQGYWWDDSEEETGEEASEEEEVPEEEPEEEPYIEQDVTNKAEIESGENKGTDIIPGIIIGGGGAFIAGAAAAASKEKKKKSGKEEENKQYRMYVSKDFGDAIKRGAKPVAVRARIDEITDDGARIIRPELTERIRVSGDGLGISSVAINDAWLEAYVYAEENNKDDKAAVTFIFSSETGIFRNRVVFRLVGKPELIFPKVSEDGNWIKSTQPAVASVIAGAGGQAKLPFIFLDATGEPEEIRFLGADGLNITEERDQMHTLGYYAVIDNLTAETEKESGIFAELRTVTVILEAVFPDDETVKGEFYVKIAPMGISVLMRGGMNPLLEEKPGVRKKLKDGCLEVISYATREVDELTLDPVIIPTGFDLCYAFVDDDGNPCIEMEEDRFSFERMQPTDEITGNILAKYNYSIGCTGGFSVEPQDSLPEQKGKYLVKLPVCASAGSHTQKAEIPIRLLGEPYDPLQDWKKEYKELQYTILRYFPVEYARDRLRYVREELNDPSIYERSMLRAMRKSTIEAAQVYWTNVAAYQERLLDYYDITENIFKKPPRFIADVALKIVFKYYFGENEGWISPVMGMCLDILDEAIWEFMESGEVNLDIQDKIMEAATSALENYINITNDNGTGIPLSHKSPEAQKMILFLSLWIVMDIIKRYAETDPRDFWEAVRKSCVDLTGLAGRKVLGAYLQQAMNSKTVQDFLKQKWVQSITEYLKKNLAPEMANIKGKGIDYRGNMKIARGYDKEMQLLNSKDADKLGELGDKVRLINFGRNGQTLDVKELEKMEKMNMMLGGPDGSPDFSTMELDFFQLATYENIIQTYIEEFFGTGIAIITDSEKLDPLGNEFMDFHIEFKVAEIGLDISFRLFVNVTRLLACMATGGIYPAVELLYDRLIGWYPFSSNSKKPLDKDVGREIATLGSLPSAND